MVIDDASISNWVRYRVGLVGGRVVDRGRVGVDASSQVMIYATPVGLILGPVRLFVRRVALILIF